MPTLSKITCQWSGWTGAPGFTHFYCVAGEELSLVTGVGAFFGFITDLLPLEVLVHTPNSGDTIDVATGSLVGSWSAGAAVDHGGTDAGSFSAPSGLCITWNTGAVAGTRRLRGRTFIVPLGGTSYQADGTIADGRLAVANVAATNLLTACPTLSVYSTTHRVAAAVNGHHITDRAAVLRTRRA